MSYGDTSSSTKSCGTSLQPRDAVLRRLALSAVVLGLLGLSACDRPQDKVAPVAQASSSVAPAPKPVPPSLPERASGLWETTISEQGSSEPPRRFKICMDKATDQQLGILGTDLSRDTCFKHAVTQNPDGTWAILSECNMGSGGINAFSGSISGDYSQNYTLTLRSQTMGASLPQMNRIANLIVISKRISACDKDQKGGDMIEGGVKINLFEMAGKNR